MQSLNPEFLVRWPIVWKA